MKLKDNQLENLSETLEDFRALLPRYSEVKKNPELLKKFCSRNRNPIWDLTNNSFFKTGLCSEGAIGLKKGVDDHYIQRSRAIKFIFDEIEKNPLMNVKEFIGLIKKFCSTVKLTKQEHQIVSTFAKNHPDYLNYESYLACGIRVVGLSEYILR